MILSFGSGGAAHALALLIAGTAVLAYAMSALADGGERPLPTRAWQIGWLAHALVLLIDFADLDAPPGHRAARFGFAPVLSTTAWLVLTVHAIESRFMPLPKVRRVLAILGAVSVALAAFFPGEPHPAATTPWAPLHWMLGVASYGLFGAAVLHASMLDSADRQLKLKSGPGNGLGPGRLRRAVGHAAAGRVVDHAMALGPQDRVLAAGLGGVRRTHRRPPPAGLARPPRHALAVCRRRAAAAGLRRLALRPRSAAAPISMKAC
jgi:hypothetical protein